MAPMMLLVSLGQSEVTYMRKTKMIIMPPSNS